MTHTVEYVIKLDNDRILIRCRFNGRVFDIEFGPEDLHDPINSTETQPFKQQYLEALHHSFFDDESEEATEADEIDDATEFSELQSRNDTAASPISSECGYEEDPLITFAVGPFLTHGTFETFAPESSTPCLNTLQDLIHPPHLSFGLHIVDGSLAPVNRSPEEKETIDPPWAAIWESQHWLEYPRVNAKDVVLAQISQLASNTNLVMFDHRLCWFKPVLAGVDNLPYIREIDMLFNLAQTNLCQTLRFPRLQAIVLDEKYGGRGFINGLILSAIYPNNGTVADQVSGPEQPRPSNTLCERWYHDVEHMVHTLHKNDFIWGDVSPNNMIPDEDENVWIIDFGGGYTMGWVEPEDMQTKRGDLEGLKRLKEYLLDANQIQDTTS